MANLLSPGITLIWICDAWFFLVISTRGSWSWKIKQLLIHISWSFISLKNKQTNKNFFVLLAQSVKLVMLPFSHSPFCKQNYPPKSFISEVQQSSDSHWPVICITTQAVPSILCMYTYFFRANMLAPWGCVGSKARCFKGAQNTVLVFPFCEGKIVKVQKRKQKSKESKEKIGN